MQRFLSPTALLCAAVLATASLAAGEDSPELIPVEISTVGIDLLTQAPIVILNDLEQGRTIPIWIGVSEAQAILRGLHEIETPRPMTHDLIHGLVGSLGYRIARIKVHDLRNGIYYGAIVLQNHATGEEITVDSRPSDALALATRGDIAIHVTPALFDEARDFLFQPTDRDQQVVRLLGLTLVSLGEDQADALNWSLADGGVLVREVGSVAREKGLQVDDIVIAVEEEQVWNPGEVLLAFERRASADTLRVTIWRGGERLTFQLPVAQPSTPADSGIEI